MPKRSEELIVAVVGENLLKSSKMTVSGMISLNSLEVEIKFGLSESS